MTRLRKRQIEFNEKYIILSVDMNNSSHNYCLNNTPRSRSGCERDLGVLIITDLHPRAQCIQSRNHANKILGLISRSVGNRSAEVILKLYSALVRPYLNYAFQFWSPYYKNDIKMLESVQRRMTKMIHRLRNLPYEDRQTFKIAFSKKEKGVRRFDQSL